MFFLLFFIIILSIGSFAAANTTIIICTRMRDALYTLLLGNVDRVCHPFMAEYVVYFCQTHIKNSIPVCLWLHHIGKLYFHVPWLIDVIFTAYSTTTRWQLHKHNTSCSVIVWLQFENALSEGFFSFEDLSEHNDRALFKTQCRSWGVCVCVCFSNNQ